VSVRLDSLSEQHPLVSEALITISGSVRNTATLLEVLVATKMAAVLRIAASRYLIYASLSGSLVYWIEETAQRLWGFKKDAAQKAVLGLQV
jgi:hypothetical protein